MNIRVAITELSKLRNLSTEIVACELRESSLSRRSNQNKWSLIRVLTTPRLRMPLCLVVSLQAGQQFTGINAVM